MSGAGSHEAVCFSGGFGCFFEPESLVTESSFFFFYLGCGEVRGCDNSALDAAFLNERASTWTTTNCIVSNVGRQYVKAFFSLFVLISQGAKQVPARCCAGYDGFSGHHWRHWAFHFAKAAAVTNQQCGQFQRPTPVGAGFVRGTNSPASNSDSPNKQVFSIVQ